MKELAGEACKDYIRPHSVNTQKSGKKLFPHLLVVACPQSIDSHVMIHWKLVLARDCAYLLYPNVLISICPLPPLMPPW